MNQAARDIVRPLDKRPHGLATRGIDFSPKSVLFEGRFGRIFRSLPAADFGNEQETLTALGELAERIVAEFDCPSDKPDDEESQIPAAFTYFGQFIDHDLTFDPLSSLVRQNDPDALIDFRTPAFDLDCLYGRGPDDQPYLYDSSRTFALGEDLTGVRPNGANFKAKDLPRGARDRAIIGDPRNDENVIVSQLQGLFLRFHNRYAKDHPKLSFTDVQRQVRFHYQWIIFGDFLTKIVSARVLADVLPHLLKADGNIRRDAPNMRYYRPRNDPFMPFEFSGAAYRFGHSMVRPGYRLNGNGKDLLQPIFPVSGIDEDCLKTTSNIGLTGFHRFPRSWALDWPRYIDLEPRPLGSEDKPEPARLQFAYRIDASIVDPLGSLPEPVVDLAGDSLARRNLIRGWRLRLPSGQAVAHAMGVVPIPKNELLIGKALDDKTEVPDGNGLMEGVFDGNAPLWAYILAEAGAEFRRRRNSGHHHEPELRLNGPHPKLDRTPQLGEVGGRIVAETFAGILHGDPNSFWSLDPLWRPTELMEHGRFGLREFIKYALGDGLS